MSATTYPMPEFNSLGIAVPAPANGVAGDFSGGSVTATGGTAPRTLSVRASDRFNVRDYGATGNGTTDDTIAVQAAFTAASAGNSEVWFPPGRYVLSSAITASIGANSLTVRGSGAGASVLLCSSNGLAITTGSNARVSVRELTFINNTSATQNTGLSIVSPDQSTMAWLDSLTLRADLGVNWGWQTAISLTCIGNAFIRSCYILGRNANGTSITNNSIGVYYTGNPATSQYATGLWITDGTSIQGGTYGVYIGPFTQGISITDSSIFAQDYGIYWPSETGIEVYLTVDSTLLQNSTYGIYIVNITGAMISNCLISHYNQGAVPTWSAIWMQSTINVAITGNELRGWNTGSETGITWIGGGNAAVTGNKFLSLNHGMSMQANLQEVTISGNVANQLTGPWFFNNGITSTMVSSIQIIGNNNAGASDITDNTLFGGSVLVSYGGLAVQGNNPLTGSDWQTQGGYISWNYATLGETNFINSSGGGGGGFTFWNVASSISATPAEMFTVRPNGFTSPVALFINAANDAAAASAGVVVGGWYRNGSQLMIRVS